MIFSDVHRTRMARCYIDSYCYIGNVIYITMTDKVDIMHLRYDTISDLIKDIAMSDARFIG